jgi:spore coat protein A
MRLNHTNLVAVLFLLFVSAAGAQSPQRPLDGAMIPQFAQPLATLSVGPQNGKLMTVIGSQPLTIRMCEFRANVLPSGAVAGYQGTWVWGYLADPAGNSSCSQLVGLYGGSSGVLDTYIGPVIVNERGKPTQVTYINDLGDTATTNVLAYKYSTDQTLHWADPLAARLEANLCTLESQVPPFGSPCAQNYGGPIAAVVHLHGGEVPPEIDGGPDAWFTSDGAHQGNGFYSSSRTASNRATYRYPNTQEAAPIWFHDHTLGATRLNVYAGLAGAYIIQDPALHLPPNLQPVNEIVPLVIQDRMFDSNGQLFFPADSAGGTLVTPNPNHPYWVPEFIGDTIVVNGKAWPYLEVEPRRYRFLILNGSNARSYELFLSNPTDQNGKAPSLWVIGTDGGYLDGPVNVEPPRRHAVRRGEGGGPRPLVIMPGERYEVVVDFAGLAAGTRLTLRNTAGAPYPGGDEPDPGTTGRVLEIRLVACASGRCGPGDASYDPAGGQALRSGGQKIVRLVDPRSGTLATGVTAALTRQLTLNEVLAEPSTAIDPVTGVTRSYEGGPMEILVNNTEWMGESSRPYGDFRVVSINGVETAFSETPAEGTTEVWEIANLTADAHPIHLHLVQFQILNRQDLDLDDYTAAYEASFPGGKYVQGFGPPLDYRAANNLLSGGKSGGNPDVSPYLHGTARPPLASEAGWKDTVIAFPEQVTRLVVRWAPTDLPVGAAASARVFPFDPSGEGGRYSYVWHCHIIDHEDNEMMRPDLVIANPLAPPVRPLRKGFDY